MPSSGARTLPPATLPDSLALSALFRFCLVVSFLLTASCGAGTELHPNEDAVGGGCLSLSLRLIRRQALLEDPEDSAYQFRGQNSFPQLPVTLTGNTVCSEQEGQGQEVAELGRESRPALWHAADPQSGSDSGARKTGRCRTGASKADTRSPSRRGVSAPWGQREGPPVCKHLRERSP